MPGVQIAFFYGDIYLYEVMEQVASKFRLFFNDTSLQLTRVFNCYSMICPGTMLLLFNPPTTDKLSVNWSTPILDPWYPAIVVQSNFELPMQRIVTEGTGINRFILHNCILSVSSF